MICIVEALVMAFYFKKIRLFEIEDAGDIAKQVPEEQSTFAKSSKTILIVLLGALAGLLGTSFWILQDVSNFTNFLKLNVLFGILLTAAVVDFRWKIIPNVLIVVGVTFRIIIYVVEYMVQRETFIPQIKTDLIGFALGFGVFLLASLLSQGALGFGDVKIFGVIGLLSGAICTYATMIFCLLVSTIVSIILLVTKKRNKKDSIPFGPCIFIGYWVALILSSY